MFIRFVALKSVTNPWLANGLFCAAQVLADTGSLEPYHRETMEDAFAWFNEHLPCPPFRRKLDAGVWSPDAVAWFRPTAKGPISRMWDLVAILKEHYVPVQVIRSTDPGRILYCDGYQIVAETESRHRREKVRPRIIR